MAKKNESIFRAIFPLIRDAIRKLGSSGEWVERKSIIDEIKEDEKIKDFHFKYLHKDSAPKKYQLIEEWVGNKIDWFSSQFTQELQNQSKGMQEYTSEFERGIKVKKTGAFESRLSKKEIEMWAYKIKS